MDRTPSNILVQQHPAVAPSAIGGRCYAGAVRAGQSLLCLWLLVLAPRLATAQPADTALVDLAALDPTLHFDIRYATADNFTGAAVYPVARALLRYEAAQALLAVQAELRREGLGLLIWDAYRPLSVQRAFWALVPDERYVANPAKGSRHNRGAAVDLTLCDSLGRPLPMPTAFDDFSRRAHRDATDWTPEQRRNSERLQAAMERHGFAGLPTEWWHYDLVGWRRYAVLDVPLEDVGR
jgi:D-alanyl-D-alanine dipeptidase